MAEVKGGAIRLSAQIFKIATLIDGGVRLTLDTNALPPEVIVALFDAKQPGVTLEIAAVAVKSAEPLTKLDKNENNQAKAKDSTSAVDRGRFIER